MTRQATVLSLSVAGVLDAAGLDEEAEEPLPSDCFVQPKASPWPTKRNGLAAGRGATEVLGELALEPFDALFLQHVLDAGMLAVGAVAPVAVDLDHGLADGDDAVRG
jgi:hypothetical protein